MHFALVFVHRKSFNISPFPTSWARHLAFGVILDKKALQ